MSYTKITESDSLYNNLELLSIKDIIKFINVEDQKIHLAVKKALPEIEKLIMNVYEKLKLGGRLFYVGAGTSGRLGILDASECPPTFGVEESRVIGIIAGGSEAIKKSIENAEDNIHKGWDELKKHNISRKDIVVGIAASGTTPFVVGCLEKCYKNQIFTGCITSNPNSPITKFSKVPVELNVGPEFLTGSSRMKSGTAQKMILNMISTASMIKLGYVKGNKMIDMQTKNSKLRMRAIKIIQNELLIDEKKSKDLLEKYKSVRLAIENGKKNK